MRLLAVARIMLLCSWQEEVEMKKIFSLMIVMTALFPGMVKATPVDIVNYSFEQNICTDTNICPNGVWAGGDGAFQRYNIILPGWSESYESAAGLINPGGDFFTSTTAPDGTYVVYLKSDSFFIAQTMDYALRADTELTLSVDVGWFKTDQIAPNYSFSLITDRGTLSTITSYESSQALTRDAFTTITMTYNVKDTDPLGSILAIQIKNLAGGGGQLVVDNVRLENHAVPEPSTLLLLGIGALAMGLFQRKQKRALY